MKKPGSLSPNKAFVVNLNKPPVIVASKLHLIALFMLLFAMTGISKAEEKARLLEGPYLGQTPPGNTPEVFAPGIVSTKHYSYGGVFNPDMNAFYFLRKTSEEADIELVLYRFEQNRWYEHSKSRPEGQLSFSPDGDMMHLGDKYKLRTQSGWSETFGLGPLFEKHEIMRLTSSSKGTFVFDEMGWPDGDGVIHFSRRINGEREAPKPFGPAINTGTFNAHPFIAKDESYLIWDSRRAEGFGGSDLYISFKQEDGSWGEAINLGEGINTSGWDAAASITPDGKYLFFHRLNESGNANIYWVDATFIENLRPTK